MKFKLSIIFALFLTIFCANRLQAQEKAFPKKGEGVTLFLKRHNRTGAAYQTQFIELNKNKLGKGNAIRMGVKYTLPPLQGKEAAAAASKRANYEPLFGKELASYKVTSSELKGACFYLVSGHGGPDPGAIGRDWQNRVARRRICLRHRAPPGAQPDDERSQSPYYHTGCQRRNPGR